MSKEKILNLIKSDEKPEAVVSKLTKIFKKEPSLLNLTYDLNASLFHLFVQHGHYYVLKHFLDVPEYRPYALKLDINGDTVMHYAVKNSKDSQTSAILDLLIKTIPEQINVTNAYGNTPLHQAVSSDQQWAIEELIKNKANKTVSNKDNKTALGLAGDKDSIRRALMYLDLRDVGVLQLGERGKTPSRQEFYNRFPVLTRINTPSSASSVNSSASSSPAASAREPLSVSSERDSPGLSRLISWTTAIQQTKKYQEDKDLAGLTPDQLFSKLIEAYNCNLPNFDALKQQFCLLCKTGDVKNILFNIPKNKPLLFSVLGTLYPLVQEEYKKFQHQTEEFMSNFVTKLVSEGLLQEAEPLVKPDFKALYPWVSREDFMANFAKKPTAVDVLRDADSLPSKPNPKVVIYPGDAKSAEAFWLLTAGMVDGSKTRKYNLQTIIHTVLGLQAEYSFVEIIEILSRLYEHLDKNQKLTTYYIICQLINYNSQEILDQKSPLSQRLQDFIESNPRNSWGLGKLRDKILTELKTLIADTRAFHDNLLIKNYSSLIAWYQTVYSDKNSISFAELVNNALKNEGKKREDLISVIADELRTRTKAFYQQVPVREFYNKKWSEKGYEKNAPYITSNTNYFNKLNNFFTQFILSQPPENITNALQFMVQLLVALCPLDKNDSYPDFHNVMLIASVLSMAPVSRLKKYFDALPPQDIKTIAEINRLISNEQNSSCLREAVKCRITALPYIGILQKDLTFALEKGTMLSMAEVSGMIILDIIKIGALVRFEIPHNQTDLPHFIINQYEEVTDEKFFTLSYRAYPKKISLKAYQEDINSLCNKINTIYLQNDKLPIVIDAENKDKPELEMTYSTYELASKIIDLYNLKIDNMIKSLIEENKAIIASKKSSGIQKNNSSSTKESREAGSSVLHKTNSSSKESKEPALMAIQKTSSSTSREFATSNIQKTNSGTPSEANELVSAEHQKKSSGTPLETKDPKESNPLAYYRKNYNWREEFSHVDPQDVTTKITILNDTLKILKSTLMKTIAMHNDMQSSSPVTFIINPIYFIHKLKALTVLVSNLIKPPVERLRTMSVLSAQADDIREFNTSFRSLKAVSIDPAMAPDPSSSLSSEGSKLLAQSSEQLLFPMSEKKSQKVEKKDDQGTLVKSRRKSKTPNGEVIKRKGSVRGTFNQLTMFKAIPTSGDRSESPLRPTILPPKPEPIAGSTISRQ